jgi:hypothetical protein
MNNNSCQWMWPRGNGKGSIGAEVLPQVSCIQSALGILNTVNLRPSVGMIHVAGSIPSRMTMRRNQDPSKDMLSKNSVTNGSRTTPSLLRFENVIVTS